MSRLLPIVVCLLGLSACGDKAGSDLDGDGWAADDDCDDGDAAVFPGAVEICNGVDDDCDGEVDSDDSTLTGAPAWYADSDSDGYGVSADVRWACEEPDGFSALGTDCDDLDPSVYPGATEVCGGGDEDCDDLVDADDPDLDGGFVLYRDVDGDGFGDADQDWLSCDEDLEGFSSDPTDCADTDADIHPLAPELCNEIDDDCDGLIDDADDSIDPADQTQWYSDADGDGFGEPGTSVVSCAQPTGTVEDASDCDDADALVSPAAEEWCNGLDDDCDGLVDDGDDSVDLATASTWYSDVDGDGYGAAALSTLACDQPSGFEAEAGDCDDDSAAVGPGVSESCGSGIDDDCDGLVDCEDGDCFTSCTELDCADGTDDDLDGDIDCADTDCALEAVCAGKSCAAGGPCSVLATKVTGGAGSVVRSSYSRGWFTKPGHSWGASSEVAFRDRYLASFPSLSGRLYVGNSASPSTVVSTCTWTAGAKVSRAYGQMHNWDADSLDLDHSWTRSYSPALSSGCAVSSAEVLPGNLWAAASKWGFAAHAAAYASPEYPSMDTGAGDVWNFLRGSVTASTISTTSWNSSGTVTTYSGGTSYRATDWGSQVNTAFQVPVVSSGNVYWFP